MFPAARTVGKTALSSPTRRGTGPLATPDATLGTGEAARAPLITHHSSLITSTEFSVLSPHRSTGGQALRYFASVRLEMERREWIRRGREVVGCRSAVRVVKNKLSAPHREAEVDLLFYQFPSSAILRVT